MWAVITVWQNFMNVLMAHWFVKRLIDLLKGWLIDLLQGRSRKASFRSLMGSTDLCWSLGKITPRPIWNRIYSSNSCIHSVLFLLFVNAWQLYLALKIPSKRGPKKQAYTETEAHFCIGEDTDVWLFPRVTQEQWTRHWIRLPAKRLGWVSRREMQPVAAWIGGPISLRSSLPSCLRAMLAQLNIWNTLYLWLYNWLRKNWWPNGGNPRRKPTETYSEHTMSTQKGLGSAFSKRPKLST